jgi:hypothetical protein
MFPLVVLKSTRGLARPGSVARALWPGLSITATEIDKGGPHGLRVALGRPVLTKTYRIAGGEGRMRHFVVRHQYTGPDDGADRDAG